jgi:hypothetical protein
MNGLRGSEAWRRGEPQPVGVNVGRGMNFMERLQRFTKAAREAGFRKVDESIDGSVWWFLKKSADTWTHMHQRMCIDSVTQSVTVFWMNIPGKLNSKTFRDVISLQEWFGHTSKEIAEQQPIGSASPLSDASFEKALAQKLQVVGKIR